MFIVDDHLVVREGLKKLMLGLGSDVQVVGEAENGKDAITQVELLSPDVVLMDIKMPSMNGIDATRELKEKMPDVKVIMLTFYDSGLVSQAIEAGASGYILKDDITQAGLVQAIRDVYEGYSMLSSSLTGHLLTNLSNLSQASRDFLLSERQRNILRLARGGLANKDIGAELCISEPTVRKELSDIFDKLKVNNRPRAVAEAIKRRLF